MMKRLAAGLATAAGLSCGPQVVCVAAGSRVSTPRGLRRIEELEVGDEVIAVDPLTGRHEVTRIAFVKTAERECGALDGLLLTSDHPVFDPDDGAFHPAGDWFTGARKHVLAFDGAGIRPWPVGAVRSFVKVSRVYDITVESQLHTFVAEGVVVHNKQPATCDTPDAGQVPIGQNTTQNPPCACGDGGTGRWVCEGAGDAVCKLCGGT